MSIKHSLRVAFGLVVVAAPLAFIGCDEQKPAAAPAGGAPAAAAPGGPADAPKAK